MKVRTLIAVEVHVGTGPEGTPLFEKEEAGFLVDHPDSYWLVRNGVAEPADEECAEACKEFWNPTTKAFLQANYDQVCCAHTTGDSLHDSETGEPDSLHRMRARLKKHGISVKEDDPSDVMKKHLKLVKQLKKEANERLAREAKAKVPKKVQDHQNSRGRDRDSNSNRG